MSTSHPAEGVLKRAAEQPIDGQGTSKRPQYDASTEEVTEAEAALYDRQIRLWGLAAQNRYVPLLSTCPSCIESESLGKGTDLGSDRMRKSHIVVHNLQGIATEVIKNIALSGIGTLTIVDPHQVGATDLSSGFFFREEDVGQPRVEAAKERIQKLNPLVKIESITDASILTDAERLAQLQPDVIVSTAGSKDDLVRCSSIPIFFFLFLSAFGFV